MVVPDGVRVFLFVDPDQALFLFHPDIARDLFVIADDGQFGVEILKLRHLVGDEVMMGHRRHRQLQPGPLAHLARIGSACVDNVFTSDGALFRLHQPFAAGCLRDVRRAALADDLHTLGPRSCGHRHRHVGRVDVAIVWCV